MFDPKSSGTTLQHFKTLFHHCADVSRAEIPPDIECFLITFHIRIAINRGIHWYESLGSRVVTLAGSKRSLRDSCEVKMGAGSNQQWGMF